MNEPIIDWRDPNYDEVYRRRAQMLLRLQEEPGAIHALKKHYAENWGAFINDWMMTYDPRHVNTGRDPAIPFILFTRQKEFIQWVYERWRSRERGLGEKSRDVGVSWIASACAVCLWLFYDQANIGIGSRKKELVDNGNVDRKSLFWKIRFLIEKLPPAFIPEGYGQENKWGVIYNPENESTISGEIGDNIGMGDRTTIYFVDEADALEHPGAAEVALSQTTDCRIDISATYNVGSVFYNNKRSLPTRQVFEFDWTDDPRKRLNPELPKDQEPWYRKQLRELDRTVVASQVDRNPNAAMANTFIDAELIDAAEAQRISDSHQPPMVPWSIGIDASGMGNDETVIWVRRGRISLPLVKGHIFQKVDGVILAGHVMELAKHLLRSGPIGLVGIERDGPGGSCADQLKYSFLAPALKAVHTGRKLKNGQHVNLRAYLHDQAKEYLKEEAPFIPRDSVFRTQATGLLYENRGGMLKIESKDEYRARLSGATSRVGKMAGRSPDRWDAFMLTFIPPSGELVRTPGEVGQGWSLAATGSGSWTPLDTVMGY